MNYDTNSEPTPNTVSTVTKHIKIYSDNPIHDCIDRIIDSCVGLDQNDDNAFWYSVQLDEAASELSELSFNVRRENNDKYRKGIYDRKPD